MNKMKMLAQVINLSMFATETGFVNVPPRPPGVNNEILQESPILIDIYDPMANGDTCSINMPASQALIKFAPTVQVTEHSSGGTGSELTTTAAATKNINNGDTTTVVLVDLQNDGQTINVGGATVYPNYLTFGSTVAGVTNGAATPAQIAAWINGDPNLSLYMYAVAGLTANAVTIFPKIPGSRVSFQSSPANLGMPSGWADYTQRIYAGFNVCTAGQSTGFSWTYNVATGVFTLTNNTGSSQNRVQVRLDLA